jgi:hypothetical protein
MTESAWKSVIQLVERLGLPVVLVAVFVYALWLRTSAFLAAQHEYLVTERISCEQQIELLKEIRDALRKDR